MTTNETSRLRLGNITESHREWERRSGVIPADALLFVDIVIVNKQTGERRLHVDDTGFSVKDDDIFDAIRGAHYMWTDGNYACDCNRGLMFARAHDEDVEDIACGHSRFDIIEPDWTHVVRNPEGGAIRMTVSGSDNPAPLGAGRASP
jgi:hypothetical protein